MKNEQVAFVLGLAENGYGILRSLAPKGLSIVGCYSNAEDFGRFSKYCVAHYLDPSIQEGDRICQLLIQWKPRYDCTPLLFPTSDYYAQFLANHQGLISNHFLYHWLSPESLSTILDKGEMRDVCRKASVLIPQTHITQPEDDLNGPANRFSFPCLVKPIRSFNTPFPGGLKNRVVDSPQELFEFYKTYPGLKGTTIWQEIIEGEDDNIFQCTVLIRKSGEVGATCCVRKIRQYLPGYGIMSFGRTEKNDHVVCQALKLLKFLNYRGFASLEFKYRQKDGRYYFIEMNPRLPWYSALFADAGVNLAYLAYQDLTEIGEIERSKMEQRDEVYWVSFKQDLGSFLRRGRYHPLNLLRWLRSIVRARSYAWCNLRDPKPFFRSTLNLLGMGIQRCGFAKSRFFSRVL